MISRAQHCHRQQKLGCLVTLLVLLSFSVKATAQCVSDSPRPATAPGTATANHPGSVKSALRSTANLSNADWQPGCRQGTSAQAIAGDRLSMSVANRLSMDAASVVIAHKIRAQMERRFETQANNEVEMGSPDASRFDVHWQNSQGPAWLQDVPDWVTSNARNYRRRGLPLVHLWESPHYLVALGLSNHGVPGVYFTQKLP